MAFTGLVGTADSRPGNIIPGFGAGGGSTALSSGVQVASQASPSPSGSPGVNVGGSLTVTSTGTVQLSTGVMVGSVLTGGSGDLAGGRYRR